MNKSTMSILLAAMMVTSGLAAAQTADVKAGTQGGSGPAPAATAASGNMPNTRADVKAQINNNDIKSGTQGGSAASPGANPGSQNVAGTTSAERKAKRADRKAARKAKHKARNDTKMSGEAATGQASAPPKEGKPAY